MKHECMAEIPVPRRYSEDKMKCLKHIFISIAEIHIDHSQILLLSILVATPL